MLDMMNMSVCPNTRAMVFKTAPHIAEMRTAAERVAKLEQENAKLKELVLLMAECFPKPTKAREDSRYEAIQQMAKEL